MRQQWAGSGVGKWDPCFEGRSRHDLSYATWDIMSGLMNVKEYRRVSDYEFKNVCLVDEDHESAIFGN